MRGREGGERRGRQGNQGLNLDANLNRYCPSQSAGLRRQQAANSAAAPKLGDTTCAFSPFLSFSPSYFLSPYLYFHHIRLPRLASISLPCLQLLPQCLCLDLSTVHASLSNSAGSLSCCLFVRRIFFPLTATSLLSSFAILGNFNQQWTVFRGVREAEEEQSEGDYCI